MIENKETLTTKVKRTATFFTTPVSRIFDKLGITPNLLTIVGLLGTLIVAYLIAKGEFFYAGLWMIFFGGLDALDGALARYQGNSSVYGAFLDSVLDRYSELILFSGFLVYFMQVDSDWGIVLTYSSISTSLIVSYTRARASDLGKDINAGFFTRMERYAIIIFCLIFNQPFISVLIVSILSLFTAIQRFYIGRKNLKNT